MAVIDRVFRRLGIKSEPIINDGDRNLPSVRIIGGSGLPRAAWTAWEYEGFSAEGYQRNSDVYACISLIATAAKQVKWWDGGEDSKSVMPREVLAKAVKRSVKDPDQLRKATDPRASVDLFKAVGGPSFLEYWVSYLLLSGNDWIEIERGLRDEPIWLWLLRPDRVTLPPGERPEHGNPAAWRVRRAYYGTTYDKPAADMVHSKLFHPLDDVFGMAPIQAAMLDVDMQNESAALFKRVQQRGFVPGWIEAKEDSEWGDEQVAKLKARIKNSKQAGEELFLENAIWHPMGFPPVDSGGAQNQLLSKRDIASVFHVPPQLIGDTTSQTYSNYQEARRALYMEAVLPILVQFRDDWNSKIGSALGSPLDFDKDSFDAITAARQEATERVVKLFQAGLITQNEGRDDLEYDRVDGGDVFYAPANMVPLGEAPETEGQ